MSTATLTRTVHDAAGHQVTFTKTFTIASSAALKIIGMSASADQWAQRLSEVGAQGVKARRIFCDLTSTGRDQSATIGQAVAAGMMPVVSYKVQSVATLNSGGYDTWLAALKSYLSGLGTTVAAVFWHEPRGDMTVTEFKAGSQRFLDRVKAPTVKVGPLLNGFLLTGGSAQQAEWPTWSNASLIAGWDFMGMDVYQSGTFASPGSLTPGDRIAPLLAYLQSVGRPDMPIVIGEYNGWTAQAIAQTGETFLSTPSMWAALLFNSDVGNKGIVLTGDMLAAFKATKADSRVLQ